MVWFLPSSAEPPPPTRFPPRSFDSVPNPGSGVFPDRSIGASWRLPCVTPCPLACFVGSSILPALGIALVKPCVVGKRARASRKRSVNRYSIYYTMSTSAALPGPISPHGLSPSVARECLQGRGSQRICMFFVVYSSSANREKPVTRLRLRAELWHGILRVVALPPVLRF